MTADSRILQAEGVLSEELTELGRTPEPDGPVAPLSALCISGGGIRSATFALGAIQGLARKGLLGQFDYLSTVSGGGFIGAWLSAWARRAGGLAHVVARLATDPRGRAAGIRGIAPDDPVDYLRVYNSYLAPRSGAFSTDTWTLLATIFRNVVLNWMVLIPLMLCVLMLPRLYVSLLSIVDRRFGALIYVEGALPNWELPILDVVSQSVFVQWGLRGAAGAFLAVALYHTLRFLPSVGGLRHSRAAFSLKVLVPLVLAMLCFLAWDNYHYMGTNYRANSPISRLLLWTLVACTIAWALAFLADSRRGKERLRLFAALAVACAWLGASTAAAVWVVTNDLLWNAVHPERAPSWAALATFGLPAVLLSFLLGTLVFVGLSSRFLKDEDREWLSRSTGTILLFATGWTVLCAIVLMFPQWALHWHPGFHGALATVGAASAWMSSLGGTSPATNATTKVRTAKTRVVDLAIKAAPIVFLVLLAGALSLALNGVLFAVHTAAGDLQESGLLESSSLSVLRLVSVESWKPVLPRYHYGVLTGSGPTLVALIALACLGVAALMSRFVNINTFSLHGMYRDRLVRAYLGATHADREAVVNQFTGFDTADDMPLTQLRGQRPLHVVNMTLNLADASRLDWQQRKAASFTATPLHCGSSELGYRPASGYAGQMSLGTAIAISGAAASPNMGYHTSPMVAFIMTLFNARLGSWLGNPGPAGRRTWTHAGPQSAIRSLIKEALGQTSDRSEYVYLSDGGHFENLALYEMIRRRCRQLIVLDGGCDREFRCDDLGNALRKIRIDFGVSIAFGPDSGMRELREGTRRHAVGVIMYPDGSEGRLIYLKPMTLGNEAPDVLSYAASNPAFPHQSTGDQSFDESQTESYRMLGLQTVEDACLGWEGGSLSDLLHHLDLAGRAPDAQPATVPA